jgi:hypothetical protein
MSVGFVILSVARPSLGEGAQRRICFSHLSREVAAR